MLLFHKWAKEEYLSFKQRRRGPRALAKSTVSPGTRQAPRCTFSGPSPKFLLHSSQFQARRNGMAFSFSNCRERFSAPVSGILFRKKERKKQVRNPGNKMFVPITNGKVYPSDLSCGPPIQLERKGAFFCLHDSRLPSNRQMAPLAW